MEIETIVSIISNYGMAFAVTVYFLVRDWRFNDNLIETMQTLKDAVDSMKETMTLLHKGDL